MTQWIRYTLPAAAIVTAASPAFAVRYLSIEEAQKQAFPSATHFTEVQAGAFAGTDLNLPTGHGQLQFHTAGVAVFPSPKVVLKATYQRVIDRSLTGALSDSFLGGVGFFF